MDGEQMQTGDDNMTNANRQHSFKTSVQARAVSLGAGLLILLGIVFQLGELAYTRYCAGFAWFISMVAGNLWNTVTALVMAAGGPEVLRFLPLVLVLAGLALLLSAKGYSASSVVRGSRSGEGHE
jgi:hypothetical protein